MPETKDSHLSQRDLLGIRGILEDLGQRLDSYI